MDTPDDTVLAESGVRLVDQYQVVRPLSRGGMGELLLAQDVVLDRFVALKRLHGPVAAEGDSGGVRFRREARLLSQLRHPHVVVVHAFERSADGADFMVMEYVPGRDLAAVLQDSGPLSKERLAHILEQIVDAVAEAHRVGIVHRDLKPANVLLTTVADDDDFVKVVDFGTAKRLDVDALEDEQDRARLTLQGYVVGTPAYMAPEQVQGAEVDARADVYALGVMAIELLTGQLPFDATSLRRLMLAQLMDAPRMPSDLAPELGFEADDALERALLPALAKHPDQRYPTVQAFGQAMLAALRPGLAPQRASGEVAGPSALPEPRRAAVVHVELEIDGDGRAAASDVEQMEWCWGFGSRARHVVEALGGEVLGPMTDRLQAVFGEDPAREAPLERAALAALELRALIAASERDPGAPEGLRMRARLGLAAGPLALAAPARGQSWLDGPALRRAVRMARSDAGADGVGVGETEAAGLRRGFECQRQGDGASHVSRLVRRRVLSSGSSPVASGAGSSFVGRTRELASLAASLQRAQAESRCVAISVSGPSGIGKTRLVDRFVGEALTGQPELQVIGTWCSSADKHRPYQPFVAALAALARVERTDGPDDVRHKLDHLLRRVAPGADDAQRRRRVSLVTLAFGLASDAEREISGEEAQRAALFEAFAGWFRDMARHAPTVLVVDNFEYATGPTHALVAELQRRVQDAPLLLVCVGCVESGEEPAWEVAIGPPECLAITPLPGEDARHLAAASLHRLDPERSAWLTSLLADLCEGSPLLLEELVRGLVDAGSIEVEGERWRLMLSPDDTVALPAGVLEIMLQRVDRLVAAAKRALEAVAVAGTVAWPGMVRALAGPAAADELPSLAARGLLAVRSDLRLGGEPGYGFTRAALQDALYARLSADSLRELHESAADWLERHEHGDPAQHDAAIGQHLLGAGLHADALPYRLRAAERAAAAHASADAVAVLEGCLTSLGLADGLEGDEAPWFERRIRAMLTRQLVLIGDLERAIGVAGPLTAAEPSGVVVPNEVVDAALWQGRALERLGRYGEAAAAYDLAVDLAPSTTAAARLLLAARAAAAGASMKLGEAASAVAALADLLATPPRALRGLEPTAADAFRVLGNALLRTGDRERAMAVYRRSLELAEAANRPATTVDSSVGLGAVHFYDGQSDVAERVWRGALEVAERHGLRQQASVLLNNLGEVVSARAPAEAIELLQRARSLQRDLGSTEGLADTTRSLAECCLALGRDAEALAFATECVQAAEKTGSPYFIGRGYRVLARAISAAGAAPEEIAGHLRRSVRVLDAAGLDAEAGASRDVARGLGVQV